ncbi:hypothetical protein [Arcicella aurantiaca]|nr:hypothetical protein [Arcicella aurantiaca]
MAKKEHYYTQFESERFYHIYNRTIDKGKLFTNEGNYAFFLKKYDEYLSGFLDTYAYCLLGNHFHLLVKVLPESTVRENLQKFESFNSAKILAQKTISKEKTIHDIISHQLKKFFQSYSMAYNKQQDRIGTLFQKPFKRALVDNEKYFTNMVYYIHANPQKHGIVSDFREYQWSSFKRILIEKPSKLKKSEVLEWFGNREHYLHFHNINNGFNFPENWNLDE